MSRYTAGYWRKYYRTHKKQRKAANKRWRETHRKQVTETKRRWKKTKAGKLAQKRWNNSDKAKASRRAYEIRIGGWRNRIRREIIEYLGGRCVDSKCRWMNEDGTFGCADFSLLQIDHKHGGGRQEILTLGVYGVYKKIRRIIKKFGKRKVKTMYQVLCANCNWRKGR